MIKLRTVIQAFLETKADGVYYMPNKVPEDAVFPYVVYCLPTSRDTRPSEDFALEIDIWDNQDDTTALETLAEGIDGDGDKFNPTGLNNRTIIGANLTAIFYRENRLAIESEDKRINRRQLRYTVRVY